MNEPGGSPRTTIRQHPERAVPGEAAAILAAGLVAHVGIVDPAAGGPVVIPMSYHFDPASPDRLWLHGALAGRTLQHLAAGAPVCVTVTLLDGLVASKSAKYHSVNYRSAVVFGRGRRVTDHAVMQHVFERMIARYFPGRAPGQDYTPATPHQLDATGFIELTIEDVSAKSRAGDPKGPGDDDPTAPGTAGVHPVHPGNVG